MATYTYAQVYALARSTGLNRDQAIIATAIAAAESGLNPAAIGDTSLTNATWGPSVSLWQVRTLKADTGTGRNRDINLVSQPAANARAMYEISHGGRDWSAWSTYTHDTYRKFLPAATAAAGGTSQPIGADINSPTYPATSSVTVAQGNSPFDVSLNLGPLNPVSGLVNAAGPILLGSLVTLGGVALVVLGLWKAAK